MELVIAENDELMGRETARLAAEELREVIGSRGQARLLVATGASQFNVLASLCAEKNIDWSVVDAFHLDEYIGLGQDHPASFCGYLRDRFVQRVPLRSFHYLRGDLESTEVIAKANEQVGSAAIDLALVGIGENGHLAFNDPPADFEVETPYLVVDLDEACRNQQVGEGWFDSLASVPTQAISMSIQQIMKSKRILCSVPGPQKAQAVHDCLDGSVTNVHPASILQQHPAVTVLVDQAAAAKLSAATVDAARKIP